MLLGAIVEIIYKQSVEIIAWCAVLCVLLQSSKPKPRINQRILLTLRVVKDRAGCSTWIDLDVVLVDY